MILRRKLSVIPSHIFLLSLCLFIFVARADEEADFSCQITIGDLGFDLTPLAGERTASRTLSTPPSETIESLRFNLCDDLKPQNNVPAQDQCSGETRACLTKMNKKSGAPDRIWTVIPLVQSNDLKVQYTVNTQSSKSLNVLFRGPGYPDSASTIQHLNLTILCEPQGIEDPKFMNYDGATLDLEWSAPAGCPSQNGGDTPPKHEDDNKDGEPEPEKAVGSGIGWFFLVILLAFIAYFGLGAYYNYSTYGARGADLIPHRDFWKEVPYMLRDVVSHLCATVRPRRTSGRGGYISV